MYIYIFIYNIYIYIDHGSPDPLYLCCFKPGARRSLGGDRHLGGEPAALPWRSQLETTPMNRGRGNLGFLGVFSTGFMGKHGMLVIFWLVIFAWFFFGWFLMVSCFFFSGLLSDVDRLLMVFECFWWDVYGIQKLGFTGCLTNQNQGFCRSLYWILN